MKNMKSGFTFTPVLGVALLVGVICVIGATASIFLYLQAESAREIAEVEAQTARRELQRKSEVEKGTRTEVGRLSDIKQLQDLEEEAASLLAADSARAGEIESWLAKAAGLADRLEGHREDLSALRRRADKEEDDTGHTKYSFDDKAMQWRHDVLSDLVEGLEGFVDPDPKNGVIVRVKELQE